MAKDGSIRDQTQSIDLLWGEKREPSRGPKPALSLQRITWAAIAVADAEGLEAVSMQRVAQECGVTTMALYRYVPGKAELLALMIDMGLGDPPDLESVSGGWRPRLEEWARQLWTTFHGHPWSLSATDPVRLIGPNELGWLESASSALSETGLIGGEVVDAVIAVLIYVRSKASYSVDMAWRQQGSADEGWEIVVTGLLRKHGDRFPALMAAQASGAFGKPERDGLEFGLQLVLDGLGVRIAERAARHQVDE